MSSHPGFGRPEPIGPGHIVAWFSCGAASLDDFLKDHAIASHHGGAAKTYVSTDSDGPVVGYYSIAVGSVLHADATPRMTSGLSRNPVPVAILARLAVADHAQGRGLGSGLLKDALLRLLGVADSIGIRSVVVHAKDETAKLFYQKYGFTVMPGNPLHLHLMIKDIRASV